MPTGEALKPERDPPGVLTGRTGKKEAPWVGLPRLPSFPVIFITHLAVFGFKQFS